MNAVTEPVPVTVLTGFLGAGKTTLLSHLLKRPEMEGTAVVINEFGEIGLDHALIERGGETVVEMQGGCLCCTIRGDLVTTLQGLLRRRAEGEIAFHRIVIETTGLADPAPILHTLMADPLLLAFLRLDGVATVVDAVNGEATLDAHEEAVKQAAVADRLLVTKTDLARDPASRNDLAALRARLAVLNPAAPILDVAEGEVDPAEIVGAGLYDPATKMPDVARWLKAEAYADAHRDHHHGHHHHHHDPNRHDAHIRAYCITRDRPIPGMALMVFMEALGAYCGRDLLRVKGIVNVLEKPDRPAVIHGVQHLFHPVAWLDGWPDEDRRSRIVFITRDVPASTIEAMLAALDGHVAVAEGQA